MASEGVDETPAHTLSWEETDLETRYRRYLDGSAAAQAALDGLAGSARAGETVVLVCHEADDERCHRRIPRAVLRERL